MKRFKTRIFTILAVCFWFGTVALGLGILLDYENSPGPDRTGVSDWPDSTAVPLDAKLPVLLMFAHPQCPCTRASLNELARLVAQCRGRMIVHVLFYKPTPGDDKWTKSDLWESATSIPGVHVQADEEGREASLFHARTSGFCALYSPAGKLLYSGGITSSRGHEGDNVGRDAIANLVAGEKTATVSAPAFGCLITDSGLGLNSHD